MSNKALQQLAALLLERAGLKINPDGYHSLRLALSTRMPALGIEEAEEYVQRLLGTGGEEELRSLLPLVTVGHTEFFRDAKQFRALEKSVLPTALARARREMRKVSIWSAGCATGEEPYSLAMALAELGAMAPEVDLWATDLNLAAVEAARQGRFSSRRCLSISPERLLRFFRPVEEGYEALPLLREYIRFDGQNLAAPVFDRVAQGSLDAILCRNVIIYFDLPTIRGLMDRFLGALRPGGLLFLGYSESLFKVYDRFEMIEVEGSFVYRRPLTEKPPRPPPLKITPYPGTSEPPSEPTKPGTPEAFAAAMRQRVQADAAAAAKIRAASMEAAAARGQGTAATSGPASGAPATPRPRITLEMPAIQVTEAPRPRATSEIPVVGASGPRATSEIPAVGSPGSRSHDPASGGSTGPRVTREIPAVGTPVRRPQDPATGGSVGPRVTHDARLVGAPGARVTTEMPAVGAPGSYGTHEPGIGAPGSRGAQAIGVGAPGTRGAQEPAVSGTGPRATSEFPAIGVSGPRGPREPGVAGSGPRATSEFSAVGAPGATGSRITQEMPAVGAPGARGLPDLGGGGSLFSLRPRTTTGELPAWPKVLPPAERLALAVQKMAQGDFLAAISGVQRLLADEPSDLDALLTLGNLYSLTGRIAEAREAFAQSLLREPLCVEARVFGGVAALQAGDLVEARSELSKALFLEPTLAIGHYLLAQVQERTQDNDAARRSYRNAVAQLRFPQRPLAGHYPDMPDSAEAISRAARYALAALEEQPPH